MAIRTRIRVKRRPKNMIVAAIALLALATVLTACGGSDPVPRSFENEAPADDDEAEPTLPATVASEVGLSYRKGHFMVEVGADRLFCLDGRNGAIFEKPRKGKAQKVGEFKTDEVGADNVKVKKPGGTYYATLAKGTFAKYGSVAECSGAKSANVRV
jgi:hypothetical protein